MGSTANKGAIAFPDNSDIDVAKVRDAFNDADSRLNDHQSRLGNVENSASELVISLANETIARTQAVANVAASLNSKSARSEIFNSLGPGDAPGLFTADIDSLNPSQISDALIAASSSGKVARVTGTARIGHINSIKMEPGRVYNARFAFTRRTNSADPSNDAVRLGLRFYNSSGTLISSYTCEDVLNLVAANARQARSYNIALAAGNGIGIVAPAGTTQVRAFIETFGNTAVTDFEVISVRDLSDGVLFSPNLDGIDARLQTQEGINAGNRLNDLETAVGNPSQRTLITIAALQAATISSSVNAVTLLWGTAEGDGLGGLYYRTADSGDYQSADGAYWTRRSSAFKSSAANSVLRTIASKLEERVAPEDFYTSADGINWRPAIHRAAAALGVKGGVIELAAGRTYYVDFLNIGPGVHLRGQLRRPDNPRGTNQRTPYDQLGGITLESTGTITLNALSALSNVLVTRANSGVQMAFPAANVSAYEGLAIKIADRDISSPSSLDWIGSDGATIENVQVIGFKKALFSNFNSRLKIKGFYFDCNPGAGQIAFDIQNSYDISDIEQVHAWPFGTIETYAQGASQLVLRRYGIAVRFYGNNDGTRVNGVFAGYFDTGIQFDSTASIRATNIWVEHYDKTIVGVIGVLVLNSYDVGLGSVEIYATYSPLTIDCGPGSDVTAAHINIDGANQSAISVVGGNLHFQTAVVRNADIFVLNVVSAGSYVDGVLIDENSNAITPVSAPAGGTSDHFQGLSVIAPYKTAGTPAFGTNAVVPRTIPSASILALPTSGRRFTVTGTTGPGNMSGGYDGRQVVLEVQSGFTFFFGGNFNLAGGVSYAAAAGSLIVFEYNGRTSKWDEMSRKA